MRPSRTPQSDVRLRAEEMKTMQSELERSLRRKLMVLWPHTTINLHQGSGNAWVVTLEGQEGVAYHELLRVSEIFGSTDININAENYGGGCETCGYGGEPDTVLYIKDATYAS